jgi:hypothetical protein
MPDGKGVPVDFKIGETDAQGVLGPEQPHLHILARLDLSPRLAQLGYQRFLAHAASPPGGFDSRNSLNRLGPE